VRRGAPQAGRGDSDGGQYSRIMRWPADAETTGAGSGLGAVVGVHRVARAHRVTLVAEILFWVTLAAAIVVLGARSGWLGAAAAGCGVFFAFTRGTSDAWIEPFVARLRVSLGALGVLVLLGLLFPPAGGRLPVLAYAVPGAAAWAMSIWYHLRRAHAAWICCADGMLRTDDTGVTAVRFTWPEVSTVTYACRLKSVPHPATREGYAWLAEDRFTLLLADGTEHRLEIPSGGPPDLLMHAGPPSPISTTIAERVSELQFAAARERLDAGDPVPFGPLMVTRDGLGTTGGVVPWSEIGKVRVDDWAFKVVYNTRTEEVPRYVRLFIPVRAEAADDGRDPQPSRWNVGDVPDLATLQRVRMPDGQSPSPAEIDAADSQIPNLFTLLRILDLYEKR
jgi:hypothetical protein